MRKFVKSFLAPVEEKLENASPSKIAKTGVLVLDKINDEVEEQRHFAIQ